MFVLNRNTVFHSELLSKTVHNAIAMLERDRDMVFAETEKPGGSVVLVQKSMSRTLFEETAEETVDFMEKQLAEERYTISVCADKIVIYAQGDLGFVYGLLHLSEQYMGIRPFWFWMDQKIEPKKKSLIAEGVISSRDAEVAFRGWHLSDDVLFQKWIYHANGLDGWKMVLEALLRCKGNVAVTGQVHIPEEAYEELLGYGIRLLAVSELETMERELGISAVQYSLQRTNHVAMLPEHIEKVCGELRSKLQPKQVNFWLVQCSNMRPHIYFLDAVRKCWAGEEITDISQAEEFVGEYFAECEAKEEIEALYYEYPEVMMKTEGDERIGEQFYTENVRLFCHQLLVDRTKSAKELLLLPEQKSLTSQIKTFGEICKQKKEELEKLCLACTVTENGMPKKNLLSATIGLHIKLHQTCRRAGRCFARGYESLVECDYERAFLRFGDSAVWFEKGVALLRGAEQGVWKDFYENDSITDIRHTAYMVKKVSGLVRELGDDAKHESWYQKYCLTAEESEMGRTSHHVSDFELYEAMKKRLVR